MIGDAEQYQGLTALYGSYGDGELVELGRGMADLTEMAQEVLKGELTRRGLTIALAAKPVEARVFTDEEMSDMRSYAALATPECTFEFEDDRGASAAYYALTVADIRAIVLSGQRAQGTRGDVRGPRVVVTPKDAERAAAILSQPLEGELRPVADEPEEFAVPRCPACGGEETLLESADPVNQWRCDDCGKVWLEDAAPSLE